jgi:hypothetical protein
MDSVGRVLANELRNSSAMILNAHSYTYNVTVRRNRVTPAACRGVRRVERNWLGLDFGRIQPLGFGGEPLGAKVCFQPLGVSCQMSLFR